MWRQRHRDTSWIFSLRGRLLFLICLATLPALLIAFFAAENEREAALARAERDALHLAAMASREHAHQIQGARGLLAWLGGKLAAEGSRSQVLTEPSFLRGLLAGHPQLANIGVLSPDGEVLSSAHPLPSYRSWRDNPAYLAALESDTVVAGSYVTSPIFARPTLNHALAVRDAGGRTVAVLFNGLDLAWLEEMARQDQPTQGLSIFIVDRDGHVLASDGSMAAGSAHLHLPRVPELSRSRRGAVLTIGAPDVRRYVVAAPLAQAPGLHVAVSAPYDELIRGANSVFLRTLLLLGVLTIFTVLAVFLAAELGILRGLRSLAHAARRLGAGELGARAVVPLGRDELASLVRAFNTMADSLEARHAEASVAQQRLRALASRLATVREEEAARISRSLHDEMGQALTALKFDLARIVSCCPSAGQPPACALDLRESLTEATARITDMVDLVRRISSELRPGVLDRLGLVAALQWLAEELSARTGLVIRVVAADDEPDVAEVASVTLFRVAQEALTNVIRHAEATMVVVSLEATGDEVTLTIRDDGKGISQPALGSSGSLGLIGMQERVALVDGRLSIDGGPEHGTTVTAQVPAHPKLENLDAAPPG